MFLALLLLAAPHTNAQVLAPESLPAAARSTTTTTTTTTNDDDDDDDDDDATTRRGGRAGRTHREFGTQTNMTDHELPMMVGDQNFDLFMAKVARNAYCSDPCKASGLDTDHCGLVKVPVLDGKMVVQAMVAVYYGNTYISFRGTITDASWFLDTLWASSQVDVSKGTNNWKPTRWDCDDCKLSANAWNIMFNKENVQSKIYVTLTKLCKGDCGNVIVTGHSLGGMLGAYSAADLLKYRDFHIADLKVQTVKLWTYGAGRAGNPPRANASHREAAPTNSVIMREAGWMGGLIA